MIERTVQELVEMIDVKNDVSSIKNLKIKGVSINSLSIEKGNLFIPLKGENRDGHEFVKQALEAGASASLWQEDVPNPPQDLPLIFVEDTLAALQQLAKSYRDQLDIKVAAVTGSNGKTTTKDILAALLSLKFRVQKTIGNFNNHIGLPLTILSLREETEVAVLEMGMSNFGEIDFLTKMAKPDAAIITNIGDAHLQDLGSREGISRAKLEILHGLNENGLFVYPGDEPLIEDKVHGMQHTWKKKTFGKTPKNDFYPSNIQITDHGSSFSINECEEVFRLPVMGEYNVLNALAAMIVASEWGVPFTEMNKGFAQVKITGMRMELSRGMNGSQILNDAYNASPTSMKAVIDLVSSLKGYSKKVVILADMLELGPEEKAYHEEIGKYLDPEKIHLVYTFGNLGKFIADGARENFEEDRIFYFNDKKELIEHLKGQVDSDTFILAKASRGMKLEEVVNALSEDPIK